MGLFTRKDLRHWLNEKQLGKGETVLKQLELFGVRAVDTEARSPVDSRPLTKGRLSVMLEHPGGSEAADHAEY